MKTEKSTGRITYERLAHIINNDMTNEQKHCDVTYVDSDNESFALDLVLPTEEEEPLALDDNHPVFIELDTINENS